MSRPHSVQFDHDIDDLYSDSESDDEVINESNKQPSNQTTVQSINQSIKQAGASINNGIKNVISTTSQSINQLGQSIKSLDLKDLMNPDTWQTMYLSTASRRARFAARCYQSSLLITLFIQLLVIVVCIIQ